MPILSPSSSGLSSLRKGEIIAEFLSIPQICFSQAL
jgi:hypothetical protein